MRLQEARATADKVYRNKAAADHGYISHSAFPAITRPTLFIRTTNQNMLGIEVAKEKSAQVGRIANG